MGKAWPALDIHLPDCDPQLQDLLLAELDDFQPSAIQEADDTSRLRAFFGSAETRDAARRALAASFGIHLFVEPIDIDDEDWATRSQSALRAVTVGRLVVAPPWDVIPASVPAAMPGGIPVPVTPLTTIVIQPSMGFGTGHHATTRLMLKALQSVDVHGADVLDVGCGSGVLAIAAVQLGARAAVGMDIDPDALTSANENLELNATEDRVRFQVQDFRELAPASNVPRESNVVLANLTGGLLEQGAETLAELVTPGGVLIVSGFMERESNALPVLGQFLTLLTIEQEDDWLCAVLSRGPQSPL